MIRFIKIHHIKILRILLAAGYGISIPGLWIMRNNPEVFQLSWIFTTISLVILILFHKPFSVRLLVALLVIGAIGWAVEAIGTGTGWIFGSYTYGKSLGPKILGTPISMAINWMLSIYLVTMVLKNRIKNIWLLIFFGASLMVIYDIILEPVAIRLDMWSWENGIPPLQNYIAWFVVSVPLILILLPFVKKAKNTLALIILFCQIVLFAALNLLIVFAGF